MSKSTTRVSSGKPKHPWVPLVSVDSTVRCGVRSTENSASAGWCFVYVYIPLHACPCGDARKCGNSVNGSRRFRCAVLRPAGCRRQLRTEVSIRKVHMKMGNGRERRRGSCFTWGKGYMAHERGTIWKVESLIEVPVNGSVLENNYVHCGVNYADGERKLGIVHA